MSGQSCHKVQSSNKCMFEYGKGFFFTKRRKETFRALNSLLLYQITIKRTFILAVLNYVCLYIIESFIHYFYRTRSVCPLMLAVSLCIF